MVSYHINPKTGNPGICRATKFCPFGSMEGEHFASKAEARAFYEGEMGSLSDFRKRFPLKSPLWREGGCEALAGAIADITGWRAWAMNTSEIYPELQGKFWRHSVVTIPGGGLLDAYGVHHGTRGDRALFEHLAPGKLSKSYRLFAKKIREQTGLEVKRSDLYLLARELLEREKLL